MRILLSVIAFGAICTLGAFAQPSVKLLQGRVLDAENKNPVQRGMITMMMNIRRDSTLTRRAKINAVTGNYQIIVEPSEVYSFIAEAPGYYAAEIVAFPKEEGYEEIQTDMSLKAAPPGDTAFTGLVTMDDRNELISTSEFDSAAQQIQKNRGVAYKVTMQIPLDIPTATDRTGPSFEQRYLTAMRTYMSQQKISSLRLTWEIITSDAPAIGKDALAKQKFVTVSIITNGAAELPKDN